MGCPLRLFVSRLLCQYAEALRGVCRRMAGGLWMLCSAAARCSDHESTRLRSGTAASQVPVQSWVQVRFFRLGLQCARGMYDNLPLVSPPCRPVMALTVSAMCSAPEVISWYCRGVVQAKGNNKWRGQRSIRGRKHTAFFDTRTEAALFYDLIGGDGANFPGDFDDADQMAETLRDVRSLPNAWLYAGHMSARPSEGDHSPGAVRCC